MREFLRASGVVKGGEKIVVAVSGGIDSMVLLHLLHALQPEFATALIAAHFNHELRGRESDDDESFVREAAHRFGVECYVEHANTLAIAEMRKRSLQETARDLRYAFLTNVRSSSGFDKIATAHHADDNAETMLFNMFRGAGVKGLSGIPAWRKDINVVRPLIFAAREEIRAYAEEHGVAFREDSSNAKEEYTRNFLRQTLIPQIRENINPNLVAALRRTSELFTALDDYIREEALAIRPLLVREEREDLLVINLPAFHAQQLFLQEYFLQRFARDFSREEVEFGTVKMLLNVSHAATGSSCRLGEETVVYKDRDSLRFTRGAAGAAFRHQVLLNTRHDFGAFAFGSTVVERAEFGPDPNVEFVDGDRLGSDLVLRTWVEGDWFVPLGMSEKKKLSDFFIDLKVPVYDKHAVPILTAGSEIAWVCGRRLDERYKVTPQTRTIIKLEYSPRSHGH
jgi:tRNA(Ile)-lysidine synthase